jgi:NADPH2:quinone reductase
VLEVGPGVEGVSPGDRVGWVRGQGSYAERIALDAELAIPVPDGVTSEVAAAALLQGMTAQYLAALAYPVREGDTVLVHAGAGGVGLLLTQLVKLRGGRVIATTSSDEKAELARGAGADEVVGYEGFAERVRELVPGGVHAVYDGIAAATFDESLASLRPFGTLVLYGSASGPAPPFDPMRLMKGSLFLTRPTLHDYGASREQQLELAGFVFDRIAAGELSVRIGARYPLEQARQAQEDLEARRTTGKLLLLPR